MARHRRLISDRNYRLIDQIHSSMDSFLFSKPNRCGLVPTASLGCPRPVPSSSFCLFLHRLLIFFRFRHNSGGRCREGHAFRGPRVGLGPAPDLCRLHVPLRVHEADMVVRQRPADGDTATKTLICGRERINLKKMK